jgi:hypothetical protein
MWTSVSPWQQVARLNEQVLASDADAQSDAAVISSLVHDGTEVISSGLGEVEHRKRELRGIDDKFMKLLKSLELTQDASYHLRASLDNTS